MSIDEQWELGFDWFHVRDLTGDDFIKSPLLSIKNKFDDLEPSDIIIDVKTAKKIKELLEEFINTYST